MTGASGAANGAVNGAANGGTHRKTISITEKDSLAMVVHSPEVPRCISPKGGSISDFTAEMTCLFWFEAPSVYQQAENIDKMSPTAWVPRLSANAFPSDGFRSWVNRMINTTQVTQNVILLALLFIYRLKFLNVIVRGKPGSEFRLLTVALMLGNKFLDDNTYTNKTWSDVSGLHVKEIHVMEVEFLSNMRYSLLVSKDEWEEWLVKLAKFRMYYERASTSTLSPPNLSPPRPLASPMSSPTTYHSASTGNTSLSPQAVGSTYPVPAYSPTSSRPTFAPVPATVQLPAWPGQLPTPHGDAALGGRNGSAKRSMSFEDITEPPPKRSSRYVSPGTTLPPPIPSQAVAPQSGALAVPTAMSSAYGAQTSNLPANLATAPAEARRLPAPQLTLNTAAAQVHAPTQLGIQTANAHAGYPPAMSMQQQQQVTPMSQVQVPMALPPPLAHGVRAMATVYSSNPTASGAPALPSAAPTAPATTTGYAVQPPMLTTSGPVASMVPVAPTANASNTSYTAPQTFGTPTKRMSPMNTLTPNAASVYAAAGANSSPLGESFPHLASGVHTPLTHSPSVYLQQRSSPYRPIRNVHMLLNPPPTSSLQDYQSMGPILIPPTQMYYNPLGRPNDLRPGIVPEFQGLQPPFRHGASLTPIHALQQPAMQMPVRDARVQQAQQQQAQQQQQQQQQLLAHAQAYAHQQSQYNN
ncbi:hypothetical protein SEUCBS139899_002332 [Sporothrix eucalyptigena]|uniref:Uncharacterized protein n=1 Tax=Sporothrix eucalyptigena TaxID=1812306 RepID=A0ABP0BWA9_9PEZI